MEHYNICKELKFNWWQKVGSIKQVIQMHKPTHTLVHRHIYACTWIHTLTPAHLHAYIHAQARTYIPTHNQATPTIDSYILLHTPVLDLVCNLQMTYVHIPADVKTTLIVQYYVYNYLNTTQFMYCDL